MNVSFQTESLRECCLVADKAEALFDGLIVQQLMELLASIEAFENGAELLEFLGDAATICGKDALSLRIGMAHRATFAAVGVNVSKGEDGAVDWSKVKRLKLMSIEPCQ